MAETSSFKEKEQSKIQLSDLSTSLQEIINGKVDRDTLNNFSQEMADFKRSNKLMMVTIGSLYPDNPTNNKNLHLNLTDRVLYVYTNQSWRPVCMIPKN